MSEQEGSIVKKILTSAIAALLVVGAIFWATKVYLYPEMRMDSPWGSKVPVDQVTSECWPVFELEKEIVAVLETGSTCEVNEDCKLFNLGCPFGCSTPLNITQGLRVSAMTERFHDVSFENECGDCRYKCLGYERAECVSGRCEGVRFDYESSKAGSNTYCPASMCAEQRVEH